MLVGFDTEKASTRYTTPILRTFCGCDLMYFDEMEQTWVEVSTHGPSCHRKRFPIIEDLADSTIYRRKQKEAMQTNWQAFEESLYSG